MCSPPGSSLSRGFFRQEYWNGLLFPSPGIFLTQESNLCHLHCRWILYHWDTWDFPICQTRCDNWVVKSMLDCEPENLGWSVGSATGQVYSLGHTHTHKQYFVYISLEAGGEVSRCLLLINPGLRTCQGSILGFFLKTPFSASKWLPPTDMFSSAMVVERALDWKSGETGCISAFITESPCDLEEILNLPVPKWKNVYWGPTIDQTYSRCWGCINPGNRLHQTSVFNVFPALFYKNFV